MIFLNKKVLAGTLSLVLLFVFLVPALSLAQQDLGPKTEANSGIVICGNPGQPTCNFDLAVQMINNIINWIIGIATVIFAISFIYGGFMYILSKGDSGKQGKAKDILWNTLIGFVIILVAWLVVYTVLKTFVDTTGTGKETNKSIFNFIGLFNN